MSKQTRKLNRLISQLNEELKKKNVTQQEIMSEMTEGERKTLEKLVGMPYVTALMNNIGVPDGINEQQPSEQFESNEQ